MTGLVMNSVKFMYAIMYIHNVIKIACCFTYKGVCTFFYYMCMHKN